MLTEQQARELRNLPSVNHILKRSEINDLIQETNFNLISDIVSQVIEKERKNILSSEIPETVSEQEIISKIMDYYHKLTKPNLRSVVNGTGVVLHTNLGRAKLSKEAILAVQQAASFYSNLEYRLMEGKRGSRYEHVEDLLIQLTGAEAAMVVNNNASAVILILKEMAQGKEVIVSRGQLVEIGGSFRVSEIMSQSGAKLIEVGTTNRTHLFDYERVINEHTGLLMKVHTSNFRMVGFTKEVPLKELVQIGREANIPVYEDLGSGVLYDLKKHGIGNEPTVQETVQAGADLVSFSGDKLLGGPQAGIIVGKRKWIERIKKNQLNRSLRVDKMTLAALEATLRHYLNSDRAIEEIPTLRMILMPYEKIKKRSEQLAGMIQAVLPDYAEMKCLDGYSEVGGGSLPDVKLPTHLIAITLKTSFSISDFGRKMRMIPPHIIGRIEQEQFLLDVRTIEDEEFSIITEKIKTLFQSLLG